MSTITAARPIPVVLTGAAELIDANGLCEGDYWPDAAEQHWRPGLPLCLTGAIGVAAGYTDNHNLTQLVAAEDSPLREIHPAVRATLRHLDLATPEELFAWADARAVEGRTGVEKAAAALRACAAEQRKAAA